MEKEWAPSWWGRQLTGSPAWSVRLAGLELSLTVGSRTHSVNVEQETSYRIHSGLLWTDITFYPLHGQVIKVDGLPNDEGQTFKQTLDAALTEKRISEDVSFLQAKHHVVDRWLNYKAHQEQTVIRERRWFTHEMQAA